MKKICDAMCRRTPYWLVTRSLLAGGFAILLIMTTFSVKAEKAWYPVEVDVWNPPFNDRQQREGELYTPLDTAQKKMACARIYSPP